MGLKLVTSKGTVTDFRGGDVSVTVRLNEKLAAEDTVCVYIDEYGIYHMVTGSRNQDSTYTFVTGHFSTYAIMVRSNAEKIIAEQLARAKKLTGNIQLKASSAKTTKGNIKVTLKVTKGSKSIEKLKKLGYTVKYKYYRSTGKTGNYKAMITKSSRKYINTTGKKGTRYYYKAKVMVYDSQGKLVTNTKLSKCKYTCRKR